MFLVLLLSIAQGGGVVRRNLCRLEDRLVTSACCRNAAEAQDVRRKGC